MFSGCDREVKGFGSDESDENGWESDGPFAGASAYSERKECRSRLVSIGRNAPRWRAFEVRSAALGCSAVRGFACRRFLRI
jgi:hypothetical protein